MYGVSSRASSQMRVSGWWSTCLPRVYVRGNVASAYLLSSRRSLRCGPRLWADRRSMWPTAWPPTSLLCCAVSPSGPLHKVPERQLRFAQRIAQKGGPQVQRRQVAQVEPREFQRHVLFAPQVAPAGIQHG
jgi:hypothetical protein